MERGLFITPSETSRGEATGPERGLDLTPSFSTRTDSRTVVY